FSLSAPRATRVLDSFPTRRSSDLDLVVGIVLPAEAQEVLLEPLVETVERLEHAHRRAIGAGRRDLAREPPHRPDAQQTEHAAAEDRKSTRLNSSHRTISYAVFCLK